MPSAPYFTANNVVSLFFNVTKAPLNDPAVRQAVSYGINRQQLSAQGETGYELPATSTSGLLLPASSSFLTPSLANNLPATGDAAKVSSILTADGWSKVGGKWTKNGKTITFSIADPIPYSDYYLDAQAIAKQLNAARLQRHRRRHRQPDRLAGGPHQRHLRRRDPLEQPGPDAVLHLRQLAGLDPERPGRQAGRRRPRAGATTRRRRPRWPQYAGSNDPTAQQAAITKLENIMTTQVPVAPLLYGAAW